MNIKVCTLNIRKNKDEGQQSFDERLPLICHFIGEQSPDIIGFQEVMPAQFEALKSLVPGYDFFSRGRLADGSEEAVTVCWKKDVFRKKEGKTFWISDTPDEPGSRVEGCYWPRICTWVELETIKEPHITLKVYNAHFDNEVKEAQFLGAKLLLKAISDDESNGKEKAILMGDFNLEPQTDVIRFIKESKEVRLADLTEGLKTTYHDWGRTSEKIDYIFTTDAVKPISFGKTSEIVAKTGSYISDHWPVVAEVEI